MFRVFVMLAVLLSVFRADDSYAEKQIGWSLAAAKAGLQREGLVLTYYKDGKEPERTDLSPADGETKYGYTFYKTYQDLNRWGGRPAGNGWCRVVETGTTRFWHDDDHDGEIDASEVKEIPYLFWYSVDSAYGEVSEIDELPGPDGVKPTLKKRMLDDVNSRKIPQYQGVGDLAYVGTYHSGTGSEEEDSGEMAYVLRGPFFIRGLSAKINLQLGSGKWIASSGYAETELKSLTRAEGYGKWLDGGAVVQKFREHRERLKDDTVILVKDIVKAWDKWYNVPLSDGPDVKGLYMDVRPYMPKVEELSKELKVRNSGADHPEQSGAYFERTRGEFAEMYIATIDKLWIDSSAPWADQPFDAAHARLLEKKNSNQIYKNAKEIQLKGADEAIRSIVDMSGTRIDAIVFRKANVVVEIMGTESKPALDKAGLKPLRLSEKIALKILEKMNAKRIVTTETEKKEAEIKLTAAPNESWADGESASNIRIEAKGADGLSLAGVRFEVGTTSEFAGTCDAKDVITDPSGVAEFTYTAGTRPGTNTVVVRSVAGKAEVVIRHGGIVLEQENKDQLQLFSDGEGEMTVTVKCSDAGGSPITGTDITMSLESPELPSLGTITPESGATDKNGIFRAVYTPPLIGPEEGVRCGQVAVKCEASVGFPAKILSDTINVRIYTGDAYSLKAEKNST
jgi:hypothetical protein